MTYTPDPDNSALPTDSIIAETAQAEFRALKDKINTMVGLTSSGQSLPALYTIVAANLVTALAATAALAGSITVLTALVNTKAPLVSPNFSGVPTAPTAPFGDNSTQLATTAFVQLALASAVFSGLPTEAYVATSQTLTNGRTYMVDTSGGTITLILPPPSTSIRAINFIDPSGSWYTNPWILDGGGNNIGTPDQGQAATVTIASVDQQFKLWWNGTYWRFV